MPSCNNFSLEIESKASLTLRNQEIITEAFVCDTKNGVFNLWNVFEMEDVKHLEQLLKALNKNYKLLV